MKKKVLVVCAAGNSRSAALSWQLKSPEFNCDAIAVGCQVAPRETIEMLCEWADEIVVMTEGFKKYIFHPHCDKIKLCEVGEDRWVNPTHPELVGIVLKWAKENMK